MASIILIAAFLWIELLQYQRKLLFSLFGVSIACLLLYYKRISNENVEIFPLLVYCGIEIFPLMLQAKENKGNADNNSRYECRNKSVSHIPSDNIIGFAMESREYCIFRKNRHSVA